MADADASDEVLASLCSERVGEAMGEEEGWTPDGVVVLEIPLTVTETVSMLPAPWGPSIVSVLSLWSSPSVPVPEAGVGVKTLAWLRSQGIGVSSAPPKLSSLPNPSLSLMPLTWTSPFERKPPLSELCSDGRGKSETGELTATTRSRARRYAGRYR